MPRDTYDPYSKRNSLRVLVGELRAKIQGTGIVRATFLSQEANVDLTSEQQERIEAALRKRLGTWYGSWIEPLLAEIEAKDPKIRAERVAEESSRKVAMSAEEECREQLAREENERQEQLRSQEGE